MVLSLSVRHVVYRLLHVAKRFGPKRAFFSCKGGTKHTNLGVFCTPFGAEMFCYVKQSIYHVSYAQRKNHQVPIYRRGNESLLFHGDEHGHQKDLGVYAPCK